MIFRHDTRVLYAFHTESLVIHGSSDNANYHYIAACALLYTCFNYRDMPTQAQRLVDKMKSDSVSLPIQYLYSNSF